LAAGRTEWTNLSPSTQTDWEDLAEAEFGWPIVGSPRFMDGETFFANYLTVLRLINPAAAVPSVPAYGPTWQTKPKFFEFAEWISGTYTLKAENNFDTETVLLFSGLPPSTIGFKPDFAREQIVGSDELFDGLYPDDTYDGLNAMMESAFGPIDSTMKIWGRIWEVQDGYIRTLKDPCTPDPGAAPPPATNTFDFNIYNDYWEEVEFGDVYFQVDSSTQIGHIELTGLEAFDTRSGTVTLSEGYDLDDIHEWWTYGQWIDFSTWDYGPDTEFDLEPFDYTIFPDYF
jgi:hypothetical protein